MNQYKHLEKRSSIHDQNAWSKNLLRRTLPDVFFENSFMKNFLKAIELILVTGFSKSSVVKKYFKF